MVILPKSPQPLLDFCVWIPKKYGLPNIHFPKKSRFISKGTI
jgi:hypothetical protein